MNEYVKRMMSKDGKMRLTIYREECPDNPRYNTDEPLHCEDWSRDYSIMDQHERETKSEDAGKLIRYLLARYGDNKKIVKAFNEADDGLSNLLKVIFSVVLANLI